MIQSYINTVTPLVSNEASLQFQTDCIRTRSCSNCGGWLCHNEGSANYDITEGGLYEVTFNATVSSATAGVVAFALFNNGEQIPSTLMAETLAAAGDYANIGINKKIKVCCRGNSTISVRALSAVVTPTDPTTVTETEIPIIVNANLSINRIS